MFRGTTPTIHLNVKANISFQTDSLKTDEYNMSQVWITFKHGKEVITYEKDRIFVEVVYATDKDGNYILSDGAKQVIGNILTIKLSQEETLALRTGEMDVQIRCLTLTGNSYASVVKKLMIDQILQEGVIS